MTIFREHRALTAIVVAHALIVPAALFLLDRWAYFGFPVHFLWSPWWAGLFVLTTIFSAVADPTPVSWRRLVSSVLVFLLVGIVHSTFVSGKQVILWVVPYTWDRTLADVDAWLHGGWDAWQWLAWVYQFPLLVRFFDRLYLLWLPIYLIVTYHLAYARPSVRRTQYLLTFALLWIVLGNLAALVAGAGGPCYYAQFTGDPARFAALTQALQPHDTFAGNLQQELWRAVHSGGWTPMAGISAMPSLHVAIATVMAIIAWGSARWWVRLIGLAYVLAIQFASVLLGWHYAIDGYVAAGSTLMVWGAVGRCLQLRTVPAVIRTMVVEGEPT